MAVEPSSSAGSGSGVGGRGGAGGAAGAAGAAGYVRAKISRGAYPQWVEKFLQVAGAVEAAEAEEAAEAGQPLPLQAPQLAR